MNAGARRATGAVLLFLHADTVLSDHCIAALCAHAAAGRDLWGRFDVRLSGRHFLLRIVERLMNWRSRATGIATGDQAIFVSRGLFDHVGGFADLPLMEDIELCRRLKRIRPPLCLPQQVVTSSRRWEQNGILRTIVHMWRLRLAYWLGVDPLRLARRYYP
jgi:rSAM/selenodomain-associated transferase 2